MRRRTKRTRSKKTTRTTYKKREARSDLLIGGLLAPFQFSRTSDTLLVTVYRRSGQMSLTSRYSNIAVAQPACNPGGCDAVV
jgi:hypothetical protein